MSLLVAPKRDLTITWWPTAFHKCVAWIFFISRVSNQQGSTFLLAWSFPCCHWLRTVLQWFSFLVFVFLSLFRASGLPFVLIRALIRVGSITRRYRRLAWTVVPLLGVFVAGLVIDAWLMASLGTIYSTNARESIPKLILLFSAFTHVSNLIIAYYPRFVTLLFHQ